MKKQSPLANILQQQDAKELCPFLVFDSSKAGKVTPHAATNHQTTAATAIASSASHCRAKPPLTQAEPPRRAKPPPSTTPITAHTLVCLLLSTISPMPLFPSLHHHLLIFF
ncbi:hypothetical protein V6N11_050776 [Hibiscus sabdariffa]|uniref:Uncharacterized protein n=1 Tax=Hibiscus sabdariffa TaxID=183260 RepID=A0ABR2TAZ1_9ROSI